MQLGGRGVGSVLCQAQNFHRPAGSLFHQAESHPAESKTNCQKTEEAQKHLCKAAKLGREAPAASPLMQGSCTACFQWRRTSQGAARRKDSRPYRSSRPREMGVPDTAHRCAACPATETTPYGHRVLPETAVKCAAHPITMPMLQQRGSWQLVFMLRREVEQVRKMRLHASMASYTCSCTQQPSV